MIDLLPDPAQQQVVDSLADFLREKLPVERLGQAAARHPHESRLWHELAGIGCFALSLPEPHGGVGLTLAEQALAFREYGRFLLSPTVLGTVLAVELALAASQHALCRELAEGRRRAALALAMPGASLARGGASGGFQLFDAEPQDLLIAWTEHGAALFEPAAFAGAETRRGLDGAVTLQVAQLHGAAPLCWVDAADCALPLQADLLVSAMLVGISEAVRDMAVEQAKTRMQFGQPIGTFQAIKHRAADMALRAEAAWSQTAYAALALAGALPDAAFQTATAKLIAARAALDGAADNIQIHGGMGFTAEVQAHLFLKRAHLLHQVGGNVRQQQARLLALSPGT